MANPAIHGFCDERFSAIGTAFEKNFTHSNELGGAFALAVNGEFLVDLWGGYADEARSRPWHKDTLVGVSSTTKIMIAFCGLMLVDRGLIELDKPVAHYWPEFGTNGKENIPVRYLFCHASGVAGFEPIATIELLYDWDAAVSQLAGQAPWWEPGTSSGYHAMTFGYLLGELVRRTTGQSIQGFFKSEVADRLDADFHIGTPDSELHRIAEIVSNGTLRSTHPAGSIAARAEPLDPGEDRITMMNSPDWHRAVVPSANGIGNARSIVKIGSVLANQGSLHGQRFLSPEVVTQAHEEQIYTHDLVMDMPVRMGLGFGLASPEFPLPFPNSFHWGGYGGSCAIMEPDRGACFSYVTNFFDSSLGVDARGARLNRAAVASLMSI